jgi:hypothetical protein
MGGTDACLHGSDEDDIDAAGPCSGIAKARLAVCLRCKSSIRQLDEFGIVPLDPQSSRISRKLAALCDFTSEDNSYEVFMSANIAELVEVLGTARSDAKSAARHSAAEHLLSHSVAPTGAVIEFVSPINKSRIRAAASSEAWLHDERISS